MCELSSFQLEDIDTFRARVAVDPERHARPPRPARLDGRVHALQTAAAREPATRGRRDPERRRRRAALRAAARRGRAAVVHARPVRPDRLAACQASVAATTSRTRWPRRLRPRRSASPRTTATARCARSTPRRNRLELAADRHGVRFVNDSKATNPESAMMALTAFDDPLRLILGGSLKGGSFDPLAAAVADAPVAGVYLIGEATGAIAAALDARSVPHSRCGDLATAVAPRRRRGRPRRRRAALTGLRLVRSVPRLRAARCRDLPPAGRGGARWRLRQRRRRSEARGGGAGRGGARSSTTC